MILTITNLSPTCPIQHTA